MKYWRNRHNPFRNLSEKELGFGVVLVLIGVLLGSCFGWVAHVGFMVLTVTGLAYASGERNQPVREPQSPYKAVTVADPCPYAKTKNGRYRLTRNLPDGRKAGQFVSQAEFQAWLRRHWDAQEAPELK